MSLKSVALGLLLASQAMGIDYQQPDWSRGALVPEGGRANIHQLNDKEWQAARTAGKIHALNYPVEITGVQIPIILSEISWKAPRIIQVENLSKDLFKKTSGFKTLDDFEAWLGLSSYPKSSDQILESVESVPYPEGTYPNRRMGTSLVETENGVGLTFSCAACHVGNLFGTPVIGMPTRFPRANTIFKLGKTAVTSVPTGIIAGITDADPGEVQILKDLRRNIKAVDGRFLAIWGWTLR